MRARPHWVKIAERRFERDCGAGAVFLSPDHPTLVRWRHFQRNCVCTLVTDANREQMLRQMHAATDALGRVSCADWQAVAANIFSAMRRAEHKQHWAQLCALDSSTLDNSRPTAECVQTSIQAAAP
jgi:hypothetical protein